MYEVIWGTPIALALFFAGIAAGSFVLAVLADRRSDAGFDVLATSAALLAPPAIGFGLCMLILDLRYKWRFWYIMQVFNYKSPMSIGVWLLTLFFILSVIYAGALLPAESRRRVPLVGRWPLWEKTVFRQCIGLMGLPVAVGVSVYTGVLLSMSAFPLWRNPVLPLLFNISALDTGFAGAVIAMLYVLGRKEAARALLPVRFVTKTMRGLLPLYCIVLVAYLVALLISAMGRPEALRLISGWHGLAWWAGVVGCGVLLPFILEAMSKVHTTLKAKVLFGGILVGGFILRAVLVVTGQEYLRNAAQNVLHVLR